LFVAKESCRVNNEKIIKISDYGGGMMNCSEGNSDTRPRFDNMRLGLPWPGRVPKPDAQATD
jgi:hypothetical protein